MKSITPGEIVEVYKAMMKRQEYESAWITPDGLKHITDTGYAADGAFFFLEELLTELNAVNLLKEVEEDD